ncbi:MAG: tRNA dihydrouridine synthase DusB [Methylococcaceae bacterium]|nr:tRNA dihydrouridine synthase DusB [Methylococcaceae bacterium]
MQIGPYTLPGRVLLAPMAGITDRPFRQICRSYGAALAYSEMVTSIPALQDDRKTLLRCDHRGETGVRAIQIVGADPERMAEAARLNVTRGAQLIDINMGCPAKKVCNVAAGSALLRDEKLVARILDAVVAAVDVPVTLKIRTGWDPAKRNAVAIARIAQESGIAALTVHGRSRACGFSGPVEYHTIGDVKAAIRLPVIANGDIDSPERAKSILDQTGADAVMIGRAALGRPWLLSQIHRFLETGNPGTPPTDDERRRVVTAHLGALHQFYGQPAGVRIARKHVGWYSRHWEHCDTDLLQRIYQAADGRRQIDLTLQLLAPSPQDKAA